MAVARMLSRAGTRRMVAGSRGRCRCEECDISADAKTQRVREDRAWRKELDA
jgi:hypothetical protein